MTLLAHKLNYFWGDGRLSPELRLLTLLCRKTASDRHEQNAIKLLAQSPDWTLLLRLAERHGVLPLVTQNLKSFLSPHVDQATIKQAEALAKNCSVKSFFLASELIRLQNEFAQANIPFVAFKGPALSQQAFSNLNARTFSDLDLIISPADVARAVNVLTAMGLEPVPARTPAEMIELASSGMLTKLTHEHTFGKTKLAIANFPLQVDLHWNVAPISFERITFEDISDKGESVVVCGQKIKTMQAERCLVALAVHATKHQFADLKWLVDIAELSQRPLEWAQVYRIADKWHAHKIVDLALYLTILIDYDLAISDADKNRIIESSDLHKLASATVEIWNGGLVIPKPTLRQYFAYNCAAIGRIDRAMLFLLSEIFAPSIVAWQRVKLPPALYFFYYVITPALLCLDFIMKRGTQVEIAPVSTNKEKTYA